MLWGCQGRQCRSDPAVESTLLGSARHSRHAFRGPILGQCSGGIADRWNRPLAGCGQTVQNVGSRGSAR